MKRLPLRTLFALALIIVALATRLPARGGFVPTIDQPGSCASMPYGLVGCWSGEGNTNDATGNHNAYWDDTPLFVPGVHGQAFSFNAWNRVIVPDAPDLRLSGAFTLSAWINPNAVNNSPETGGIFSKVSNGTGLQGFQTALVNNNQTLVFLFNATGQSWPGNVLSVDLPQPLPIGQWAHVAFTFDGQDMRIYLNAQVIGTLHTGPVSVATSPAALMISGDGNNNVKFRGAIDEAAVFNRALSSAEINGIAQWPLHILSTTVPNTALNQPYSQAIQATGGTAPYYFTLSDGSLPMGLSLSSNGVLSGTVQQYGDFSFTVRVDDAAGRANTMSYSMHVLTPNVTPQVTVTSDGRFGPASHYFFDNYAVQYYIHTDSCQIYQQYSNYPWDAYNPQPAGRFISQPNGPDICVLDFTDFVVNMGNSSLTIVGSHPLLIATQGDVSIRGNIRALNNGGTGGSHPEGNFDLGNPGTSTPGSIFPNAGGGGWGAAYVFSTTYTSWGWDILVAASGGGGGSAAKGAAGVGAHTEYGASIPSNYPSPGAPGEGGAASTADILQGGGGGGQGGYAHTWYCCYTGGNGANGGGAVMFQSAGNVLIQANSSIVADGLPTPYYQGEVGAGGAGGGGYILFDAAGTFDNRGILSSRGGAGTSYSTQNHGAPGAGGRVVIRHAQGGANTGIIDVSGGDESSVLGGEFIPSGIAIGGTIKGIGSNVLHGSSTGTGDNVFAGGTFGTLTFTNVTSAGVTTMTAIQASGAGQLPSGYASTAGAFEVQTTATYSGPITVCFFAKPYASDLSMFNRLRVLHLENGALVDRTILAPNQPAPDYVSGQLCANTPSLSPFYIALVDAGPTPALHFWHADYNLDFMGVRTTGDQFLNVPLQFQYGWHFGIFNDQMGPLADATIAVNTALAGLNAPTPPDALPYTWTRQLGVGGAYSVDLGSTMNVPTPTPLGYEVSRQLSGGRTIAANATETRTFTLTFTSRESEITHLGASVQLNGQFNNSWAPIVATDPVCTGVGKIDTFVQAPQQTPAIHWQVGDNGLDPALPVPGTAYTLTCTVTVTNLAPYAVSYMPAVVAEGQIAYPKIETTSPVSYPMPDLSRGPSDPLGSVTYSVSTPNTSVHFDQRFQRTVIFDGENKELDTTAPVTLWSLPFSATGWYRGPVVDIDLNATDAPFSSGIKRLTYSLSGAQTKAPVTVNVPTAHLQVSAEGTTTVTVFAEDNAGNIEQPRTFTVQIDRAAPTTTSSVSAQPSASGWYRGPVTVNLSAIDGGQSGLNLISYTITPAGQPSGQPVVINGGTASVTMTGSGSLTFYAQDNAGNQEPMHALQFNIDTTAPTVSAFTTPGPAANVAGQSWWNTNVTVNINGNDVCNPGPCSSTKQVWYSLAGAQTAPLTAVTGSSAAVQITTEGTTTVTYYAEDNAGNTSASSTFVVNLDKTAPVVTLNASASLFEGQLGNLSVTASDVLGSLTYQWTGPNNGGTFTPSGSTATYIRRQPGTVSITARVSDGHGNQTNRTATIQIINVAPTVNVPSGGTVTAGQSVSAPASFSDPGNDGPWTASVNYGDGSPAQVLGIAMNPDNRSGSFTLSHTYMTTGDVVVMVTVTDAFGAVGTNSIALHVAPNTTTDNAAPVQASPTTTVSFTNVATDGVTTSTPISPAQAPILPGAFVTAFNAYEVSTTAAVSGPITVCFNVPQVTDALQFSKLRVLHGENGFLIDRTVLAPDPQAPNFATKTICARTASLSPFVIAEVDSVPPVLSVADVTVTATDATGAVVTFDATATDDHSTPTVVCSPTSGSLFPIGDTTVSCTATDDAHNSTTASFTVSVLDGVAPAITAPTVAPVEATSATGATVTFAPAATDNVAVASVSCAPASGSTFAIGSTNVTCAATDAAGNSASTTFAVTVTDTTAPTLSAPSIVTATATTGTSAIVNYTVTASDVVDGGTAVTCAPASGTAFTVGNTTVQCTTTDAHNNTASATFTVKVNDGLAPTVTVTPAGNRTAEATSAAGAVVTFSATSTDNVDGALATTCAPASGSTFALGETTVTCRATDAAGNTGSTSFTVTVVDTTAPQLSLPGNLTATTTDTGVAVTFSATAVDLVDGARVVTCAPASGSIFAVGQTTVTCSAADTRGNTAPGSFLVTVTKTENRLGRFVAYSQDGTWLRSNVTVVSGGVGANDRRVDRHGQADDDSDRDDATVRIGENTKFLDAGSQVVGNVVVLLNKASVYNVLTNALFNRRATVLGTTTNTVAMPYLSLPSFPSVTPGTTAIDVKKKATMTLAAGSYGKVHVAQGATLILTGGVYQMLSLDVDEQATVLFRGPSELRIKTELDTDNKSKLILDQSVAGLKASQMVIHVEGADAVCAHDGRDEDGADNGSASVHIGEQNVVQANIRALNGTVWIKSKTQATGAFIGRHVRIGQNVTLTLDSAWR